MRSLWTLLICSLSAAASASGVLKQVHIVKSGPTLLECRAPSNSPVIAVEWSKIGLMDKYVLLFLDGHYNGANQHPQYMRRTELRDRRMKDRDVSLVLKNATADDYGTYECRIFMREANRRKRSILGGDPVSIIKLIPPEAEIQEGMKLPLTDCGTIRGNSGLVPLITVFWFGLWQGKVM
ncbi:uncharacterized protein KZ484_003336 [Pholidichthys leucotaenia]